MRGQRSNIAGMHTRNLHLPPHATLLVTLVPAVGVLVFAPEEGVDPRFGGDDVALCRRDGGVIVAELGHRL